MTLTPSIGISEGFDDNIFQDNRHREWDFVTNISPALTLFAHTPDYDLSVGYSFGAILYARNPSLDRAFDHHNLIASGLYRLTAGLTVSAADSFVYSRNSSLVGSQGLSTGRQESWSNAFGPGASWQMTQLDTVALGASYNVLRYQGGGIGADSDTYTVYGNLTHAFTPRFSGIVNYGFTYIDLRGVPDSTTHTPTIGFSYQVTRTLTASITGGVAVTLLGGDTFVTPAGSASVVQTFSFGSASLQYNQGVGPGSGFGGTTNSQTASGTLTLATFLRELFVVFSPVYTRSKSVSSSQQSAQQVDVWSVTVSLGATYQIARYASLFGGYSYLYQRTGASSSNQVDVNQNVVRFGLQLGYPIDFD